MPKLLHWTPEEIATLRANYATMRTADLLPMMPGRLLGQLHAKAHGLGLRKDKATIRAMQREKMKDANHPGRGFFYPKGNVPWNVGLHYQAGGRSQETQFKRGTRPHTWRPIGSERTGYDGYLQRKLTDTGYSPHDWVCVHHILWREAGNDIPKGHRLVFRDGNKQNITLDNLELITIAELLRRNSVHRYGKEIFRAAQLRGAITRQINRLKGNTHV